VIWRKAWICVIIDKRAPWIILWGKKIKDMIFVIPAYLAMTLRITKTISLIRLRVLGFAIL